MAKPKNIQEPQKSVKSGKTPTTMEELLASTGYNIPTLKRGQEVTGKIISASRSEILIDIGAKSEGIVYGREIATAGDVVAKLAPGDIIEATVIYPENESGQIVLSLRKLTGTKRWEELEDREETGESVEVVAMEINRGGVICEYFGLRGFLPASQLSRIVGDEGRAKDPSKLGDLIGKKLTVGVIEADRATNRLIFTQKQPDKKDLETLVVLLAKVKIGDKHTGVISAILPFGIFVEIEVSEVSNVSKVSNVDKSKKSESSKIEGLVHISEISWDKTDELTKIFKVGQEVEVMVIAKDAATGRLNLSIRQLTPDPFIEASKKYVKDEKVKGTVSKVTPFGVFVDLESGVEGLIHISKIPPNLVLNQGQAIECEIESVDTESRRIALSPIIVEKPILYR